jgi:7-cyano-7-deazaguanine synthase
MDSATTAAIARADGFDVHPLSFLYGQRHAVELEAARRVAAQLGLRPPAVVQVDLRAFGGSALTSDTAVPKDRDAAAIGEGIPSTYVPARNTIFLSFALAYAETLGAVDLFIGANALDYSGYPDCRPDYLAAFEQMANLATRIGRERPGAIKVHAPLVTLTKAQVVARGLALGVDFGLTRSCYDPSPSGDACGRCDACQLRLKGFREAGHADPAPYQTV